MTETTTKCSTVFDDAIEAHARLRSEVLKRYPGAENMPRIFALLAAGLKSAGRQESLSLCDCDVESDMLARAAFSSALRDLVHEAIALATGQGLEAAKWAANWLDDIRFKLSVAHWVEADTDARQVLPLLALEACEVSASGWLQNTSDTDGAQYRGLPLPGVDPWYPSWLLLALIARDSANLLGLCFSVDVPPYEPN